MHFLRERLLRCPLLTLACIATTQLAFAHGGQYRGPSEVVPSSSVGGGMGSGGSSGAGGTGTPSNSGSAGGSVPSGSQPAAGPAGAAAGRGAVRGGAPQPDLSTWEFWWEFQKDPLIRLRDTIGAGRAISPAEAMLGAQSTTVRSLEPPTAADTRARVVPALLATLASATDRDTITGCMVALAKIGIDLPAQPLHDVFRARLASGDQEVRETAALCLGIARQCEPRDLDLLRALLLDEPVGQAAAGRSSVDKRTRSFAAYALGLCLENTEPRAQRPIIADLLRVLEDESSQRNLQVAAIAALGQVRRTNDPMSAALHAQALAGLRAFYARDLGPGQQLVQSHCPLAIARLVIGDSHVDDVRSKFAEDLEASFDVGHGAMRSNHHIAQSCALALGELCRPWNDKASPDAPVGALLLRTYREHKDQQTRYFAILSIGRIGGQEARATLLRELDKANKSLEKPWVALALATLVHAQVRTAQAAGQTAEVDTEIGKALLRILDDVKNPSTIGATAIALGLSQKRDAGDRLRELLRDYETREDAAGQIAIGLALLGEHRAAADLRNLLPRSVRRPQLLVQVATALGRLGDGSVVDELTVMLSTLEGGLSRLSALASAVGQIGDRRCIEPLLKMLGDEHLTPLTRAFAAVALGGVCDRDPLPWNARYAYTMNYRAAVETLTDGAAGILDIL